MNAQFKPNTDGRKPDLVLPGGPRGTRRLRDMPWGGRQYRAMGVRRWSGGFEVVDLHHSTAPTPNAETFRFRELAAALEWIDYVTDSVMAWLLKDRPQPSEPALKPLPRAEDAPRTYYKRQGGRSVSLEVTIT